MSEKAAENTDVELWREREDDYYANSIHRTAEGAIGINVGGYVIVKTLADWHALARSAPQPSDDLVEVGARAFVADYWGMNPLWERLCDLSRDRLKQSIRAVLAVQPDIATKERASIVAWLRGDIGGNKAFSHHLADAIERGEHIPVLATDAIERREDKRDD